MLIKLIVVSTQGFKGRVGKPLAGGGIGTLAKLGAKMEQAVVGLVLLITLPPHSKTRLSSYW